VESVVVGQREGAVTLLRGGAGQLGRMRCPVEERVGRVAVELDVWHEHMFA
jgi:PHP family Zn ribbon phosphoesterase